MGSFHSASKNDRRSQLKPGMPQKFKNSSNEGGRIGDPWLCRNPAQLTPDPSRHQTNREHLKPRLGKMLNAGMTSDNE